MKKTSMSICIIMSLRIISRLSTQHTHCIYFEMCDDCVITFGLPHLDLGKLPVLMMDYYAAIMGRTEPRETV
jgi:hypothetical protein